ncbi:uncharacterized protein LOC134684552 [Mytilus trossulus]|uniref:uncharacterized protein LOC134684552 n=1 Tax=Mytilus trossulus TaxID=6551 RepID=UPI003005EBEF
MKKRVIFSDGCSSQYNVDKTIDIYTGNFTVDRFALILLPRNKMPENLQNFLPVNVIGDGNCIARSASVVCFGNEDGNEEVRCRIVIKMRCFPDVYMNNEHLSKHFLDNKEAQSLLQIYFMFSNEYIPGDRLTLAVIRKNI